MNTDTKKWAWVHSLREWGKVKQKLCKQACKIFAFICQSQLAWTICLARARSLRPSGYLRYASSRMPKALGCANPSNPWLVLLQPRPARFLLKTTQS
jgi:hypothetical protein